MDYSGERFVRHFYIEFRIKFFFTASPLLGGQNLQIKTRTNPREKILKKHMKPRECRMYYFF